MKAIGELCTAGGEDMLHYKDRLMPLIIDALQDQSSVAKREAALHTLGQLSSNSGYVIAPYLEYPQLLEILQNIIRSEPQHGALRQETIKLLGILGALDPYRHQQVEERSPELQRRVESTQMTDISLIDDGLTPSNKEYFPTVVINALLGILKDHSLVQYHQDVIGAIMAIFRTLGLECVRSSTGSSPPSCRSSAAPRSQGRGLLQPASCPREHRAAAHPNLPQRNSRDHAGVLEQLGVSAVDYLVPYRGYLAVSRGRIQDLPGRLAAHDAWRP